MRVSPDMTTPNAFLARSYDGRQLKVPNRKEQLTPDNCYRVERTSSRAGLSPAVDQRLFTAHCYRQLSMGFAIAPAIGLDPGGS
jgi:hypothetical protein